jgi:hypothetical protein
MIKFFRHIRRSLINQNKMGKYFKYAIGEILLVVIGILIALQINNWNEARKNSIEEQRIIEQLHNEFKANKEKLAYINSKNKIVLDALQNVSNMFPIDRQTVNLDTLSNYLFKSYDFNTFDPLQGSIEELKNNTFDIISNKKLRALLLSWNTIREDFKDDEYFAIDYSKEYNFYMQKHVSIDFGLKKPNADLRFLNSTEFENFVSVRLIYYSDIVDSPDFKRVESTINDIIQMTESK